MESPEMNPYAYGQWILTKAAKSLNKWCGDSCRATGSGMKLYPFPTPHTHITSKWITALNVRAEL